GYAAVAADCVDTILLALVGFGAWPLHFDLERLAADQHSLDVERAAGADADESVALLEHAGLLPLDERDARILAQGFEAVGEDVLLKPSPVVSRWPAHLLRLDVGLCARLLVERSRVEP